MKDLQTNLYKILRQKPYSVEQLSTMLKFNQTDISDMLTIMEKKGITFANKPSGEYFIPSTENTSQYFVKSPAQSKRSDIIYIATSDWHVGSIQHDDSGLEKCVKIAKDMGATFMLHSGDITDGYGVYPGQLNNLITWDVDKQTDLVAEEIEKLGLPIYGIGGNHDHSFTQSNGIRPSKLVGMKQPLYKDLGDFAADIVIDGIEVRLLHGAGGNAYAQSYPAQRLLRNLAEGTPELLPDVLELGHYHTNPVFEIYGVLVVHPSNFQKPNDFMIRRGLRGSRGLYVLNLGIDSGQILDYSTAFIKA